MPWGEVLERAVMWAVPGVAEGVMLPREGALGMHLYSERPVEVWPPTLVSPEAQQ